MAKAKLPRVELDTDGDTTTVEKNGEVVGTIQRAPYGPRIVWRVHDTAGKHLGDCGLRRQAIRLLVPDWGVEF